MAVSTKDQQLSRSFKERLDELCCPYTENVEEGWILELLLTPGEPRIRLLQWLFSKFDSKLNDLLDPHHAPADTKMDSRIQRLLFVSSNLGLCNPDEADLIRGISQGPRQIAFLDSLLDMVYIADSADTPNTWSAPRPGLAPSSHRSLMDQFLSDCRFVDELSSVQPVQSLLKADVRLLPPDILKQIEINRQDNRIIPDKDKASIPTPNQLMEDANRLAKMLQKQTEFLAEIKRMHQCPDKDAKLKTTVKQTIRLVLSEFDQLITSFSCCYENDMRHWCSKEPPQLNEIGPSFKRVHTLLQQFLLLMSSIKTARSSCNALGKETFQEVARIRQELVQLSDKQTQQKNRKGVALDSLVNSVKDSVDILEESLMRTEHSFISGNTLNGSVASTIVRID